MKPFPPLKGALLMVAYVTLMMVQGAGNPRSRGTCEYRMTIALARSLHLQKKRNINTARRSCCRSQKLWIRKEKSESLDLFDCLPNRVCRCDLQQQGFSSQPLQENIYNNSPPPALRVQYSAHLLSITQSTAKRTPTDKLPECLN